MKINNKAFTLVELLATIVIVGMLSSVAIAAVGKFQTKATQKDYDAMVVSIFAAAQNYIQQTGYVVSKDEAHPSVIQVSDLVEKNFLKPLQDPRARGGYCHSGSYVNVNKIMASGSKLQQMKFDIHLECQDKVVNATRYS